MKAAIFKAVGQPLVVENRPDPTPGPGQVLIKIGRAGICGSDLHMTEGENADYLPIDQIPGHEYAGTVVALGAGVTRLKIGDRIAAMPQVGCGHCVACLSGDPTWCPDLQFSGFGGAYCQYGLANAQHAAVLPPEVSDADGSLIEPLSVGLHAVRLARMQVGARVLVLGAGAIGLGAAYWARRLGGGRVVVSAHSGRRAPIAQVMGAHAFVAQKGLGDEQVLTAFRDALGGEPDLIIEAVGLPGVIAKAINWVKPRGTILSLGFCGKPDTFVPALAMMKEIRIQFSMCYNLSDYQYVTDVLATGDPALRAMVTDTVSLSQLPAKFESLRAATSPDCKVLIDPWA